MGKVPIDNLAAGMILKADVIDRSGRLLLPSGSELTDKHLQIFRTWGVLEAEVVADSESESEIQAADLMDPERLAQADAMVRPMFVHNDLEHPAINELLRLCIARKATNAA